MSHGDGLRLVRRLKERTQKYLTKKGSKERLEMAKRIKKIPK